MPYLTHRPAAGNITEGFGPRPKPTPTSPATHYGIDYGWGGGDTIRAARSGYVKSYSSSGSYGNRLIIDHGDGHETWYCHLTSLAAGVRIGDYVQGGQFVALMGKTGNVTAKHLHFELRIFGKAVDPAPYFVDLATSGPVTPIATPSKEDNSMHVLVARTDQPLWRVIRPNGSALPVNDAAEVRFWQKVCAVEQGVTVREDTEGERADLAKVRVARVSGEEWESTELPAPTYRAAV